MEKIKEKWQEWCVFAAFLAILTVVAIFHEPWYDEAQAWLIARDASWKEILFSIPHYEGHPPLWHLILALFAKSGLSIDIGLRIPGFLVSAAAVWLILFKSPFPKAVRFMLPFNYYIFYRYSVVVRPYCISMLAFCFAAMAYRKKNEHPFRFCAALMLLCASNAYGMMFAAGICLVWIIELIQKSIRKECNVIRIRGILVSLSALLICNIGQLILMIPNSDTNSVSAFSFRNFFFGMIYMCVIGPADSMFLDVGMDARLQNYAESIVCHSSMSVFNLIIGAVTAVILLFWARKYRKLPLLVVPYLFFAAFAAGVYFWYHHIGLIFFFLIFVFWCALSEKEEVSTIKEPAFLLKIEEKNPKLLHLLGGFSLVLCLGMSFAWNVFGCFTDITKDTWYTKELAKGIKECGADQESCMLQWDIGAVGPFENPEDYQDASKYVHHTSITCFFDCLAYFDNNIFYNHNEGIKEISYNRQILANEERNTELLEEMASYGYPKFIIGNAFVVDALPIEGETPNYFPVYRFEVYKPDKFIIDYSDRYIYAREDVYMTKESWPISQQLRMN